MATKAMQFNSKLIDELIKDCKNPEDILGDTGLLKQLTKALIERSLSAELTTHLGYEKHGQQNNASNNARNGYTPKTLKGEQGDIELDIPRDRDSTFTPKIVSKHQTRLEGFDDKIIAMYARGMTTRDIQEQLEELYGVEVSASLISNVTNAVIDEVKAWQSRPLDKVYPIVYLDALVIKIREDKKIINKSFYLALGVNMEGQKELLGIWVSQNEGAKFWLSVLTELKNRGLENIIVACIDGLTGFPEAIETVYPKAQVQLCIVHMVRNSLRFVGWKERKAVASDLRIIYTSNTIEEAELALTTFSEKWDKQYPSISKIWFNHWERITPFFEYPNEIRKVIYTTNAVESVNMSLRKVIKNKRVFPSDDSAFKQLYLALQNISKKWTMPIQNWGPALNHFMIMFPEAFN
jgi:putative transposase